MVMYRRGDHNARRKRGPVKFCRRFRRDYQLGIASVLPTNSPWELGVVVEVARAIGKRCGDEAKKQC